MVDDAPDTRTPRSSTAETPITDEVQFVVNGQLGLITLNRPKAINALTSTMVSAMSEQLERWAVDDTIATVAIIGAGDRGLCAGGDVRAVREAIVSGDTAEPLGFWRAEYELNAQIAGYPKPYVAMMDGIVMGGGVGVSAHGSTRLVTERTKLAMPETIIGLFPDVGATWLLSRAPRSFGMHLALTGTTIDGPQAITAGLADALIDSTQIDAVLEALAAGDSIDRFMVAVSSPPLPAWLDAYAAASPISILSELDRHDDPSAQRAAADLRLRSPLSVAVTFEAMRRASRMASVREVLDQDLILANHFIAQPDFTEGVRAQLIDKDHAPRWRHASLSTVQPAEVAAAFAA